MSRADVTWGRAPLLSTTAASVLPAVLAGCVASAWLVAACAGPAPDARYPQRGQGCAVKPFPSEPPYDVDDLGTVTVDCEPGRSCQRQLFDAVCTRGGDVAWGLGDNALSASRLAAHAAHTRRAATQTRDRGCAVQVFDQAPPVRTENIGPVSAVCGEDDSQEICLRELEDQVCQLGGDVLWQVEGPSRHGNRQRMTGRAAHTK